MAKNYAANKHILIFLLNLVTIGMGLCTLNLKLLHYTLQGVQNDYGPCRSVYCWSGESAVELRKQFISKCTVLSFFS